MTAETPVHTDPGFSNASLLVMVLEERLGRRGWHFRVSGHGAIAHRPEWPAQLFVLVREAEADQLAMVGLAIDLASMPLRGERFRDVFNNDRENLMRNYGGFTLRQLTHDGHWLKPVSGRALVGGMAEGISRKTALSVLDRPADDSSSLAEMFVSSTQRFVDTGGEIGTVLQRLYQRAVLSAPTITEPVLPDEVRPSPALVPALPEAGSAYPWRR